MRLIVLFAITTALMAQTGTVTLTWDAMPTGQTWKQVRVYERTGTAAPFAYTKVAEVAGDQVSATVQNVTPGMHTYVVRSVDGWESVDSNTASTNAVPSSPNGLKVSVTVNVQVQQ